MPRPGPGRSADPLSRRRTPNPDAWVHPDQPRDTYLTTADLAKRVPPLTDRQANRWCRTWFGPLPDGRRGRGLGYRIPPEYERVARVWMQVEDADVREAARHALLANPRNWVVVVAKVASTHYSAVEATNRVEQVAELAARKGQAVYMIPTFPPK